MGGAAIESHMIAAVLDNRLYMFARVDKFYRALLYRSHKRLRRISPRAHTPNRIHLPYRKRLRDADLTYYLTYFNFNYMLQQMKNVICFRFSYFSYNVPKDKARMFLNFNQNVNLNQRGRESLWLVLSASCNCDK